jgi:nucleoside-diphosphate-sugar epimerase
MHVFVTGATGFVGTEIVKLLIAGGHQAVGLARSAESAEKLKAAGAEVHHGSLHDTESLKAGANAADGVIHTAFVHDFSDMPGAGRTDLAAITTMGEALAGTGKPLVITSGIGLMTAGRVSTEADAPDTGSAAGHRVPSEELALALAANGVRSSIVRLPPSVHSGKFDLHGFIPTLIKVAREKGVSAFIGDGNNRWPAVHVSDAAALYILALEKGIAGSRFHAVDDKGISFKEIATTAIGKRLGVPVVSKTKEEAPAHFGWIAHFAAIDVPSTSDITQKALGWKPKEIGLLADIQNYGG